MSEPAIKGVIVQGVIDEIHEYLDGGRIRREALDARLEREDLELLEGKVDPTAWYPLRVYGRIADVALALSVEPREQACIRSGERDARRMIEGGLYQQLDSLQRMGEIANEPSSEQRFQALGRLLRLVMSLSKGIYSVSDWKVVADPDHPRRYRVEVTDAEHLPDVIVTGTVGFLNECSRAARPVDAIQWTVERPRPDQVIYRMDRGYA